MEQLKQLVGQGSVEIVKKNDAIAVAYKNIEGHKFVRYHAQDNEVFVEVVDKQDSLMNIFEEGEIRPLQERIESAPFKCSDLEAIWNDRNEWSLSTPPADDELLVVGIDPFGGTFLRRAEGDDYTWGICSLQDALEIVCKGVPEHEVPTEPLCHA